MVLYKVKHMVRLQLMLPVFQNRYVPRDEHLSTWEDMELVSVMNE
jgi:hypothetical protein